MSLHKVVEIEEAIGRLTGEELEELYSWLDGRQNPIVARIASDLSSGALDAAIGEALADERDGRVKLL